MLFERIRRFPRTLAFRLVVWHAALFTCSAAALFVALYYLVAAGAQRADKELTEARLAMLTAVYQSGGTDSLRRWTIANERVDNQLFVNVLNPFNESLFLSAPQDWITFSPPKLEFGRPRQVVSVRVPRDRERDFTLSATKLRDGNVLQVGRLATSREMILQPFRKVFLAIAALSLLLGTVFGAIAAYRTLRPIRAISATAQRIISTGDLAARVPVSPSGDELDELAALMNRLLEKNQRLISALRESLDNVAHDLRTPLARLRASADEALRSSGGEQQLREALADAAEESERVLSALKALMELAEAESGAIQLRRENTDLRQLISEVLDIYGFLAEEKNIKVETVISGEVFAPVDSARIRQAIANLLDNAVKYTPPGGKVTINCRAEAKDAVIQIEDNGCGIPQEDLPRVWERLYRADKSRAKPGLGLGLSLVRAFIKAHGGRVEIESQEGQFTRVTVRLPQGSP